MLNPISQAFSNSISGAIPQFPKAISNEIATYVNSGSDRLEEWIPGVPCEYSSSSPLKRMESYRRNRELLSAGNEGPYFYRKEFWNRVAGILRSDQCEPEFSRHVVHLAIWGLHVIKPFRPGFLNFRGLFRLASDQAINTRPFSNLIRHAFSANYAQTCKRDVVEASVSFDSGTFLSVILDHSRTASLPEDTQKPLNFNGVNFSDINLSDLVLSGCLFHYTTFDNVNIDNTDFSACQMVGARFTNCTLSNCRFSDALLTGATFSNVKFVDCNLSALQADHTSFKSTAVTSSSLKNADLTSSLLEKCTILRCDMSHVYLAAAQIRETAIIESDISGIHVGTSAFDKVDFGTTEITALFTAEVNLEERVTAKQKVTLPG